MVENTLDEKFIAEAIFKNINIKHAIVVLDLTANLNYHKFTFPGLLRHFCLIKSELGALKFNAFFFYAFKIAENKFLVQRQLVTKEVT